MSEYRTAWERYFAHFKDYAGPRWSGMARNDHDRIRALEAHLEDVDGAAMRIANVMRMQKLGLPPVTSKWTLDDLVDPDHFRELARAALQRPDDQPKETRDE